MENCEKILDLLNQYADGELGESDAQLVSAHLEVCPSCKKAYEELLEIEKLFGEATEEAPKELCEGVMAKIKAEPTAYLKRKKIMKAITGVAVAAAISLTVLSSPAIILVLSGGARAEAADNAIAMSPADAEERLENFYSQADDCGAKFDAVLDEAIPETEITSAFGERYTVYMSDGSKLFVVFTDDAVILDGKKFRYETDENKYILKDGDETVILERILECPDGGEIFFKQAEAVND